MRLHCPANRTTTGDRVIWWRYYDRIVSNGKVLPEFETHFFFDNATGDLVVSSATLADSATYKCGRGFSKVTHFTDLKINRKCLCTEHAKKYSLSKDFAYF